jgi:hypothetical protein
VFTEETDGQNISAMVLPNIFSRPHYHKLYPMLATAIFASAAGILDDQKAPDVVNIDTTSSIAGKSCSVTVDATDSESGIMSYAYYQWNDKTDEFELKSEQASRTYVFEKLIVSKENTFMIVVTDYAGNETVEMVVIAALADPITTLRINASPTVSVKRGEVKDFDVLINNGAIDDYVIWEVSNPLYATVDNEGTVKVLNKTGTVLLIATDPESGFSYSIVLRIT